MPPGRADFPAASAGGFTFRGNIHAAAQFPRMNCCLRRTSSKRQGCLFSNVFPSLPCSDNLSQMQVENGKGWSQRSFFFFLLTIVNNCNNELYTCDKYMRLYANDVYRGCKRWVSPAD